MRSLASSLLLSVASSLALARPSSASAAATTSAPRPIAIVTGGTRGIGRGIATVLAEAGHDLLVTYNADKDAADAFAASLAAELGGDVRVECVGGDLSLESARDAIFEALDRMTTSRPSSEDGEACGAGGGGGRLAVLVHNAGQYVGITSDNADGLAPGRRTLSFGDGSLLDEDGRTNLETMRYYQRLYGEAFVDLCERSLMRMGDGGGGSIVGISSPGVNAHLYGPDGSYSMPGAGKSLMEYSARIYAAKSAGRGVNVNVIVPGYTKTEAWDRIAKSRGLDGEGMIDGLVGMRAAVKEAIAPRDIGNAVRFLCSESGKFVTGAVIPVDGGIHLNAGAEKAKAWGRVGLGDDRGKE